MIILTMIAVGVVVMMGAETVVIMVVMLVWLLLLSRDLLGVTILAAILPTHMVTGLRAPTGAGILSEQCLARQMARLS